jgi:DNA-binding transcriptional LysR family regulator
MARLDINRSGEMQVFARVVELGAFSAAARAFGMTPSAVSKLMARLEGRLGARLINRSTRKLQLTAEGQAYYERCSRILAEIDEADREAAAGTLPRGRVRINCNVPFGLRHLLPLVPEFLALNPQVTLDIVLSDRVVDLLDERADLAIRVGPLAASRLMARKLGESRMALVASPGYLDRHGTPADLADLAHHNLIGFNFARTVDGRRVSGCGGRGLGLALALALEFGCRHRNVRVGGRARGSGSGGGRSGGRRTELCEE